MSSCNFLEQRMELGLSPWYKEKGNFTQTTLQQIRKSFSEFDARKRHLQTEIYDKCHHIWMTWLNSPTNIANHREGEYDNTSYLDCGVCKNSLHTCAILQSYLSPRTMDLHCDHFFLLSLFCIIRHDQVAT